VTENVQNGGATTLAATVLPANADNKTLTWSSGNTTVATVSASGVVTGRAPGTAVITARSSDGSDVSANCTVTVQSPPSITTSALNNGKVGAAYSQQLAGTGGITPYTWLATGLPEGLTMSDTGAISGTPTADGSFTVEVTLKDAVNVTVAKLFDLKVDASLTGPAPSYKVVFDYNFPENEHQFDKFVYDSVTPGKHFGEWPDIGDEKTWPTGYVASGWFMDEALTQRWMGGVLNESYFDSDGVFMLYAKWLPKQTSTHTVTFHYNYNGNNTTWSYEVASGAWFEQWPDLPPSTWPAGKIGNGWYTDNGTFANRWNGGIVTKDMHLYAQWK
jgi:hypothetical protein